MIRNTDPMGRPPKAAPVFLIINIYGYALYIPYIFHIYIPYIFPSYVPYIFPCVFLNSETPITYTALVLL